jgi:hypothetical protein
MTNSGDGTANPALGKAALKHWVRTITEQSVELTDDDFDQAAVGAIAGGVAYCQTAEERGLGGVLRWALANGAQSLTVIADAEVSGTIARRADLIDFDITVWASTGPDVVPATKTAQRIPPELPAEYRRFGALIAEAGARPIDDHGMLVAEVAGLEVARVVDMADAANMANAGHIVDAGEVVDVGVSDVNSGPTLAVGVGQADRELQDYIHGHLDDDANLRRAIAAVVQHRNPGSGVHPLARVARQRWLRSLLLDDPSLLGLQRLEPLIPLRPRHTVLGDEPSAAAGATNGGAEVDVVVVCSVGVDLDLLPEAADYRDRDHPGAELIVVVPERDRQLSAGPLAALIPNLRLESIPEPWLET